MEHNLKDILGIIAVIIGIIAVIPYVISIFKGQTTPHIFSYLIWGVTMAIAFVAQIMNNAGPGAWLVGYGAITCTLIAVLAIKYGEKDITKNDWVFLIMALAIIPIWITTKNDFLAILLASLIDLIGYFPTFRKTYIKPYSENLTTYALVGTSYIFALFALTEFNFVTSLYPLMVCFISFAFVGMVLWRRKFISQS